MIGVALSRKPKPQVDELDELLAEYDEYALNRDPIYFPPSDDMREILLEARNFMNEIVRLCSSVSKL